MDDIVEQAHDEDHRCAPREDRHVGEVTEEHDADEHGQRDADTAKQRNRTTMPPISSGLGDAAKMRRHDATDRHEHQREDRSGCERSKDGAHNEIQWRIAQGVRAGISLLPQPIGQELLQLNDPQPQHVASGPPVLGAELA